MYTHTHIGTEISYTEIMFFVVEFRFYLNPLIFFVIVKLSL